MYGEFAQVYDTLMDDFDYPAWARFYLQIMRGAGINPKSMLECGCGTGSMSIQFARHGIRLTASDISQDMLNVAQQKAGRLGLQIPFVRMDMTQAQVTRPVDAVVCCCDGVNYLTTQADVKAFFTSAHTCLKPSGVLAFDISSQQKLMGMKDMFFGEERQDICYLWQNTEEGNRVISMSLTFFVQDEGDLYRRFDEEQLQRAHAVTEITQWLGESGFEQIKTYGDMALREPNDGDRRIHFTAIRK